MKNTTKQPLIITCKQIVKTLIRPGSALFSYVPQEGRLDYMGYVT